MNILAKIIVEKNVFSFFSQLTTQCSINEILFKKKSKKIIRNEMKEEFVCIMVFNIGRGC